MSKQYPRITRGRYFNSGMPPHIVNDEDKEVYFLIRSGVAYLGIPTFMENFPEGYRGYVCRTDEKFKKLKENYNGK